MSDPGRSIGGVAPPPHPVPPAPDTLEPYQAGIPVRPPRWRRWLFLTPVVALLVILGVVQVPYFVISPGPTRDVYPLIHVRGHQTYPSSGHLLMVAVDFRRANTYEALWAWLSPTEALLPERDLLAPGETDQQEQHVALSQMDTSKIDAAIVALTRYAGYPKTHGSGVLVEQVGQGLPADGKLFAGDVIQSVDGQPAQSANQVG